MKKPEGMQEYDPPMSEPREYTVEEWKEVMKKVEALRERVRKANGLPKHKTA